MFCLKSYYSLFTNLTADPSLKDHVQKSEMAYFMLDILFLLGDPRESVTLLDDPFTDGHFMVGETIPILGKISKKTRETCPENRVRIDRTSQLLISMSITIAEVVKTHYLRTASKDKDKSKREEQIR